MSDVNNQTYLQVGYNNLLQISDPLSFTLGENIQDGSNTGTIKTDESNGSVETMSVKSQGGIGDLWITNFIKSKTWQPKSVGFYLDGQTGYAEFANVYISGSINATTGQIGGWSINSTSIYTGTEDHSGYTTNAGDITLYSNGIVSSIHAKNFYIDASGNLTTTGGTITGGIFQTATSGRRIKLSSSPANKIEFYDDTTLYGVLEADKVGVDGYINLVAQDDNAGLSVYTGVGASPFSSTEIFSNGGGFSTNGNASNGFNTITGKYGGYFQVFGDGSAVDRIGTDLKLEADWIPSINATYDLGGTTPLYWKNLYLSGNIIVGGTVDGVDVANHAHTGGAGGTISHSSLTGIGSSDHHVRYADSEARAAISGYSIYPGDVLPYATNYYDLGSTPNGIWRYLYINDIFFKAQSSSPSTAGQLRYYDSGGTQQMRVKVGTFTGSIDLTAV